VVERVEFSPAEIWVKRAGTMGLLYVLEEETEKAFSSSFLLLLLAPSE